MIDDTEEQNFEELSLLQAVPFGIGGWLFYLCVALTILMPLRIFGWIEKTSVQPMIAAYAILGITSFIAGVTTWAISPFAFVCLRIALLARLLYAIFQMYWGIRLADQSSMTSTGLAKQELLAAALNIFQVFLLFSYFKFSNRVKNTFGRNI